jgi:hypothetical protein
MSTTSRNTLAIIACAFLLAAYAATSWLAWQTKGITYDEPLHLIASSLQIRDSNFRFDCENLPFWKYYFGLGNSAIDIQIPPDPKGLTPDSPSLPDLQEYSVQILYETPANDARALVNSARARMLPLAVLLGALIALWSWRLAGPLAACVSTAAFCLDPNFLAHGLLVKNDVPIALLYTALMLTTWQLGRRATILNICTLAFLLAAAITTKFTGLLCIPILTAALFIRCAIQTPWPILRWTANTFPSRLLAAGAMMLFSLLFTYLFIWANYDFRYQPRSGSTSDVLTAATAYATCQVIARNHASFDTSISQMQAWLNTWQPDSTVNAVLWIASHDLLPESFLSGFLYAKSDAIGRGSYLMGKFNLTGWWYYFPLAMLFKTPLATLIALLTAAVTWFFLPKPRNLWSITALAIAPISYMIVATQTGTNLGLRHVFPVYPFLYIFLGITAARATNKFGKPVFIILILLLIQLSAETYSAYPDYIPFFNVAAGGSKGGARLLSDSNIDWGQELPDLARWQKQNPDYQLMLYYFGAADPRYFGIHYARLPGSFAPGDELKSTGKLPYWAISVVALHGQYLNSKGYAFYQPFRERQPTQILGGSIYLYAPWR